MLSEAIFDQFIELQGRGSKQGAAILIITGGEVKGLCILLHSIGEVDWDSMINSGNIVLRGDGADVGVVGKKGML